MNDGYWYEKEKAEKDRLRIEELERLDAEAAEYVESVIVLRTYFTGEDPYVGWKGIGLALTEALNERDALRAELEKWRGRAATLEEVLAWRRGSK